MPIFLPDPSEEEDLIKQTAETAQPVEKPRGVISQIGDFLDQGGIMTALDSAAEAVADLTEGTIAGKITRPIADIIPNDQEIRDFTASIPVIGKPMTAVDYGAYQGAMTAVGLTPAARIFNEQADWNERPASLDENNLFTELIYQGGKVIVPTLFWRKLAGSPGLGGTMLIESAAEAVGQDSATDMIAGRKIAEVFGKMYATQTSEEAGAELTRQLIEGDSLSVQPLLFLWGLSQNSLINMAGDKLFQALGGVAGQMLRRNIANNNNSLDDIALALGQDPDDVARALTDVKVPEYSRDLEPQDVITPDVIGPQLKATDPSGINDAAFLNNLLPEAKGVGLDLNDPSNYFFDWSRVAENPQAAKEVAIALFGKHAPEAGSIGRARLIKQAAQFLSENGRYMDEDETKFLMKMQEFGAIRFNDPRLDMKSQAPQAWREQEASFLNYFNKHAELDIGREEGLAAVTFTRMALKQEGLRLQTMAQQIATMRATNQDTTDYINKNLLPTQKFVNAIAGPFRKAQRDFFLLGEALQDTTSDEVARLLGVDKDLPPAQAARKYKKPGFTLDGELIKIDPGTGEEFRIDSLEQLWSLAQDGNKQAEEIFYLAMNNLRFGNPEKVLANLELTSDIVNEALRAKEPFQKYFYNVVALGQLGTQTNAVGATVFRQTFEPLALALASQNPFNRHVKPVEGLYGLGQFVGGLWHLKSSLKAGYQTWSTSVPLSGKDRFGDSYSSDLLAEFNKIREMHQYQLQELARNNASPIEFFNAWFGQTSREIAYHPWTNTPVRLLMAGDEASKVTTGAQHAWGRAFVNLWERGEFRPQQMMAQVKLEQSKIFKGPAWKGQIIDVEVKTAAERATLQEPFNITKDSNQLERWFAAQSEANKVSPISIIFNGFPRAAYRQLEQTYIENVGASVGLAKFNKKLQAIRSNPDPTQRLAFESQLALAQVIGAGSGVAVALAMASSDKEVFGFKLPKVSFGDSGELLIEGEDYDVAIETGKFAPATVYLSLMGNVMSAFMAGRTSENGLVDGLLTLTNGLLSDIINRPMTAGQQKFGRIVDTDSPNWGSNMFGFLWEFITPDSIKEIANIIQPYETVQDVRTFPGQQVLSQGAKQGFNNIQNPEVADIYAPAKKTRGKPKVYSADQGDETLQRLATFGSYFWPGRVSPRRHFDPVMQEMEKYKYSVNPAYLREIYRVELDANQQSALSFAVQGNLYKALDTYVKGTDHTQLVKQYELAVDKLGKNSDQAKRIKSLIFNNFNTIHRNVKRDAIVETGLYKDERIKDALENAQLFDEQASGPISPERQGMYAQAAKQDTPLAQQVRNILDIA